ncbi:MAG: MOSC domain-containing protein [Acidimicrobiales bacterium]
MTELQVGTVAAIRRYPVKSMLGEAVPSGSLGERGLEGDRAYALVDDETSKVVSVKRPRRWGRMFELTGETSAEGVVVRFADGARLGIDDPALAARLSDLFGRAVSVATVPPPDATFDEQWMHDLKNGVDPYFDLPVRAEGDEDDLIDGGQFMSSSGTFFNYGAVHLVTTGTTRRLGELAPDSRFDPHRFRPNLVVETEAEGFVETEWPGRRLTIGDVELSVSFTVPRCVMTTLAQGDLPADRAVLRAITEHNSVDCLGSGTLYPCVGVYADVVTGGSVAVGQPVVLG